MRLALSVRESLHHIVKLIILLTHIAQIEEREKSVCVIISVRNKVSEETRELAH